MKIRLSGFISLLLAVILCLGSLAPSFAVPVKVPVFSSSPERQMCIAGESLSLDASAFVFGDRETPIKYCFEVLLGDDYVSDTVFFQGKSGSFTNLIIKTGKGASLLSVFGTYTARIKAVSVDENGSDIACGYSPSFELEILPPFISEIEADAPVSYGEGFNVTANINSLHQNREDVFFKWTVFDGENSAELTEGATIRGLVFTKTDTCSLHVEGEPDGFFTLEFMLTVSVGNSETEEVSEKVSVCFRKEKTFGFSLGEDGMRYYKADGLYVVGWLQKDGSAYYFDENGIMATGEAVIDGKIYAFSFDGKLISGAVTTPLGIRYYKDCKRLAGWNVLYDGLAYYFEYDTGYMTAKTDETGTVTCFTDYGAKSMRTK